MQTNIKNYYFKRYGIGRKNQSGDWKKYTRFLKIFPQYFATSPDFYNDEEIEVEKNYYWIFKC